VAWLNCHNLPQPESLSCPPCPVFNEILASMIGSVGESLGGSMRGYIFRVSCTTFLITCLAVLALPHSVQAGSPAYKLAFIVYVGTGYKVQTVDMNAQVVTLFDLSQMGASRIVPVLSADGDHIAYLSKEGVTIRDTSGNEHSIPVSFNRPIDSDGGSFPVHI